MNTDPGRESLGDAARALLVQLERRVASETSPEAQAALAEELLVHADFVESQGGAHRLRLDAKVVARYSVPLYCVVEVEMSGFTTVDVFPETGHLFLGGLRSQNGPFEVVIQQAMIGDRRVIPRVCASTYHTSWPFVPVELGLVSRIRPLQITFSAYGNPSARPHAHLTFFGRRPAKGERIPLEDR